MLDNRGERILAKSLFRELRGQGYSGAQILDLTNELLDLVTEDLHDAMTSALGDSPDEIASDRPYAVPGRHLH